MKKNLLFAVTILAFSTYITAQENNNQSFWKNIDTHFGLSSVKKIDTNYYTIAPKGWMVNLNSNFAGFILTSKAYNVPTYNNVKMNLHSRVNYQLSATFGYRNLILGYSVANITGDASDFTLSLSANAWGVEFRRLESQDVTGNIQTSALREDIDVRKGDVRIKTKYIRSYFVFNSKKYSTTAAIDERCIQKRPAGSLLFYTNYSQNTVTFLNNDIIKRFNGIKLTEYSQAELGLGYGYNYPLIQGRLLFHAMAVPMFVCLTSNYITDNSLKETDTENKYFFNVMGRMTANYRINNHFGLCLSAFLNTNRFSTKDNYQLQLYDYLIKLSLCFRF